jgi:hypothetical protein
VTRLEQPHTLLLRHRSYTHAPAEGTVFCSSSFTSKLGGWLTLDLTVARFRFLATPLLLTAIESQATATSRSTAFNLVLLSGEGSSRLPLQVCLRSASNHSDMDPGYVASVIAGK